MVEEWRAGAGDGRQRQTGAVQRWPRLPDRPGRGCVAGWLVGEQAACLSCLDARRVTRRAEALAALREPRTAGRLCVGQHSGLGW